MVQHYENIQMDFVVELKISEFEDTGTLLEVSCGCGEGAGR